MHLRDHNMKNGGLEAQRVPDLLFWTMFAIGTEGKVISNTAIDIEFEGEILNINPTKVVMDALMSNLELLWYSRASELSEYDIEVTLQRICNVADAYYTKFLTLVAVLSGKKINDSSVKRHIWKHIPYFFMLMGSPKTNDTDMYENDHIQDKILFNRTSKRFKSNLNELTNLVRKYFITKH